MKKAAAPTEEPTLARDVAPFLRIPWRPTGRDHGRWGSWVGKGSDRGAPLRKKLKEKETSVGLKPGEEGTWW